MFNLDILKTPSQLISILNYENKKDSKESSITDVKLNQVSSNIKTNQLFLDLSYVCHYRNKNYKCISSMFV